MEWKSKYEAIRDLGKGGQGRVYLVRNLLGTKALDQVRSLMISASSNTATAETRDNVRKLMDVLGTYLPDAARSSYALKELHRPEDAKDPDRAEERIRREIKAQASLKHPGICQIHEVDPDFK